MDRLHVPPARQLERESDTDPVERAQLLTEAAGEWTLAGDTIRAELRYLDAIADGGDVVGDARSYYADLLFSIGKPIRARQVLDELWRSESTDPFSYNSVGEILEGRGDPEGAVRWLTCGVTRLWNVPLLDAAQVAEDADLDMLLGARARVRKHSGQPWDELDRIFFEFWEAANPGCSASTFWTKPPDPGPGSA